MSRRPNPAAERAAQNSQTLKSLLKLEANKVCADCKRNKHPRWASWNLGVFICIRCSGIHRGVGTHISKVKSVDLDAWTDEQLQSILSWGNARANKYWEAKLAPGHTPSESKIENFIRTKYELKRWVMDGPKPDPSTLDADGDDDIPLSIVKEKQSIERKESLRKGASDKPAPGAARAAAPVGDLIGGDDPIPQRASTAGPTANKVPSKAEPAPPKATNTKDSLLGLDFLGGEAAAPPRPASATGSSGVGGQSRPDLKQSILSLYASAPRPQAQQQASHASQGSFSGMQSPMGSAPPQGGGASGGMVDAFSSLSFASTPTPKSPQTNAFSQFGNMSNQRPPPAAATQSNPSAFSSLSGGSFFDSKPANPAPSQTKDSSFGGSAFGGMASPTMSAPAPKPAATSSSAALGDLFDFSTPSQPPAPLPSNPPASANASSVFNLSSTQQNPPQPTIAQPTAPASSMANNWSNSDVWGSNDWSTPDPAPVATKNPEVSKPPANDFGWESSGSGAIGGQSGGFRSSAAPQVAADEEFGGWTTSAPAAPSTSSTNNAKPAGGFGGNDDIFSNVWQ